MATGLNTAGLNVEANALKGTSPASYIGKLSLHSGDPGVAGTSNELTGGSPAYARKAVTFTTATTGVLAVTAGVTFDVASGSSVTHVGLWDTAGTTYLGMTTTNNVGPYTGQGTYTITTLTTTVTSS